jgi:hypothetical protein
MREKKIEAAPTVFYVSPDGCDEWSGRLPKPNENKTDGPFATIARAQKAIREIKERGNLGGPIIVKIREGIYWLNETLLFTPEDSGTEESPIVYQAYEGEKPIISGGCPISGRKFLRLKRGNGILSSYLLMVGADFVHAYLKMVSFGLKMFPERSWRNSRFSMDVNLLSALTATLSSGGTLTMLKL